MRRVRRHIEKEDILLFIVLLKFDRAIALVAIDYKKAITFDSTILRIRLEVV